MFDSKANMYLFRHDANIKESMLNNPNSNLIDSSNAGWQFQTSASNSGFNPSGGVQGYNNLHGSYSMPTMPGSLTSRNSGFGGGLPSGGVHQSAANMPTGRFTSNNVQVPISQLSHSSLHGHSGLTNRGTGVSSLTTNAGQRLASSAANMMGGVASAGNTIGRALSLGGGQAVSGSSRVGSANTALQGPGRLMPNVLQQGSSHVASVLGNGYSSSINASNNGQNIIGNGHQVLGGSDMNATDNVPYDINDFPQLNPRAGSAFTGSQGQLATFRKPGLAFNHQNQEFSMQSEDFPALPNFKGSGVDYAMESQEKDNHDNALAMMQSHPYPVGRSSGYTIGGSYASNQQQQQHQEIRIGSPYAAVANSADMMHLHGSDMFAFSHALPAYQSQVFTGMRSGVPANLMPGLGINSYDNLQQYQQSRSQLRQANSINSLTRDHPIKSMPAVHGAVDNFGMLGLLNVIGRTDADRSALALGTDLTALGLNLNSRESLYRTFASPCSDAPVSVEPEYKLPDCYSQETIKLLPKYFSKYQRDTLFYIFYSMPNEKAQLYAASELFERGWHYHKEQQLWLTNIQNLKPEYKTRVSERSSYIVFDPKIWETRREDNFELVYDKIEKKPQLSDLADT